MILIKVELWPGGFESGKQTLGEARIWNTTGSGPRANYGYELRGKSGAHIAEGTLKNFPRKRLLGWDLVRWMLNIARFDKQNVFEGTIFNSEAPINVRVDCHD